MRQLIKLVQKSRIINPRILFSQQIRFNFSNQTHDNNESHDDFKPKIKQIKITEDNVFEMCQKWIDENKVVLFMKGVPEQPQCGFSRFVVQALHHYGVKDYKAINILSDNILRQKVKEFSNWPTYPQLFIDGNLIGGSDIVSEMHKDGSLKELLDKTFKN